MTRRGLTQPSTARRVEAFDETGERFGGAGELLHARADLLGGRVGLLAGCRHFLGSRRRTARGRSGRVPRSDGRSRRRAIRSPRTPAGRAPPSARRISCIPRGLLGLRHRGVRALRDRGDELGDLTACLLVPAGLWGACMRCGGSRLLALRKASARERVVPLAAVRGNRSVVRDRVAIACVTGTCSAGRWVRHRYDQPVGVGQSGRRGTINVRMRFGLGRTRSEHDRPSGDCRPATSHRPRQA
jgi:hypothetical protein